MTSEPSAIWEERPVMGGYPEPTMLGLSGFEQLRSFLTRGGARPPISYLTGMRPTEVQTDSVTFTMPATEWLQAPPGGLYPGTLAILADGPLGSAIQIALPAFQIYTTAEMSLNYVRPTPVDGRDITARATTVMVGKRLGLATCVIEDADERIIATGSTRCFIFPPMGPPPDEPPEIVAWEEPAYGDLPPYERPVQGEVLPQKVWDDFSGLEMLAAHMKDSLARPPIHYLTGMRPIEAAEGTSTFALPSSEWLCSPTGHPIGGATAMLADSAIQSAIQTTIPAAASWGPLDLKVNFLRPVDPDGRDLIARGVVQHRGKTTAVATAEVVNADGKKVALATGSALILADRPWNLESPVVAADEAAQG